MCLVSALYQTSILFTLKVGVGIPLLKLIAWMTSEESFHFPKVLIWMDDQC